MNKLEGWIGIGATLALACAVAWFAYVENKKVSHFEAYLESEKKAKPVGPVAVPKVEGAK